LIAQTRDRQAAVAFLQRVKSGAVVALGEIQGSIISQ
jgi:hypothetical protein